MAPAVIPTRMPSPILRARRGVAADFGRCQTTTSPANCRRSRVVRPRPKVKPLRPPSRSRRPRSNPARPPCWKATAMDRATGATHHRPRKSMPHRRPSPRPLAEPTEHRGDEPAAPVARPRPSRNPRPVRRMNASMSVTGDHLPPPAETRPHLHRRPRLRRPRPRKRRPRRPLRRETPGRTRPPRLHPGRGRYAVRPRPGAPAAGLRAGSRRARGIGVFRGRVPRPKQPSSRRRLRRPRAAPGRCAARPACLRHRQRGRGQRLLDQPGRAGKSFPTSTPPCAAASRSAAGSRIPYPSWSRSSPRTSASGCTSTT